MSNIEKLSADVAALAALVTTAESKASEALAAEKTRTSGAVSARIVIAAQLLLGCAKQALEMTRFAEDGSGSVDAGEAMITSVYGDKLVIETLPDYLPLVSARIETLLAAADAALSTEYAPISDNGAIESAYKIRTAASHAGEVCMIKLVTKKIPSDERKPCLLGLSVLDDASILASECDRLGTPEVSWDEEEKHNFPLRESLKQVSAEILVGTVLGATLAVLVPLAQEVHAEAVKLYAPLGTAGANQSTKAVFQANTPSAS